MDSGNEDALDIIITNVVATFRTRCHLNLRLIALEGVNVIYKPEVGVREQVFLFTLNLPQLCRDL
jgi:transcription initiation factor TFIID TATA-box-binding protein